MTRQRRSAPAVRIHRTTGHARVRYQGKEYWLGRAGTPEADARYRQLIAAWARHEPEPMPPAPPGRVTVAELLALWLIRRKGDGTNLRKNAQWWLARAMAATLQQHAAVRICEFGPRLYQQWLAEVASRPITRGSAGTTRTVTHCRKIAAEFRRMIAYGVGQEMFPVAVLTALDCVKGAPLTGARPAGKRQPVPEADLNAAVDHLPPVFRAIVQVIARAGARPSEVLRLRPCEIERGDGVWFLRPTFHKNERLGKSRVLVLGPRCQAALAPWISGVHPDSFVFTSDTIKRAKTPDIIRLRRRRTARPIDAVDLRRVVRIACEAAEVPVWTPYRLRHTGLTEFRRVGGLDAAQLQGGHADSKTTERYAAADLRAAIEAARRVG